MYKRQVFGLSGNVAYSDRQTNVDGVSNPCNADADVDLTQSDFEGCQPYVVEVDGTKPDMLRAETGRWWDTSLSTGDSDDKTEYRVTKGDRTSILVVFNEHLDTSTVQARDFEVNDSTPLGADVFNVTVRDDEFLTTAGNPVPDDYQTDNATSTNPDPDTGDGNPNILGDSVQDVGLKRGYVFLTVSEMSPNAQPKVELVDEVRDLAGNRQTTDQRDDSADDRVAPTLTVTINEGDRPVTRESVTLTISSDEDIGSPKVTYYLIESETDDQGNTDADDDVETQVIGVEKTDAVVDFKSAREHTAKISPNTDGLYTVYVTADDSAGGNTGTTGDKTEPVDVDDDTTAILFERDKNISAPDFDSSKGGVQDKFEIDDPNAFIRIDYSGEANEYYTAPRDAEETDDVKRTSEDFDTHKVITIVSATLDGEDISDGLDPNTDENIFLYRATGLSLGKHEIELVVQDEAGNKNAAPHKGTITIIERKKFKLDLNPGWNLISLPGTPADTDINAIIPADHPADTVLSYDPSMPGGWLTAVRGGDTMFTGTLETIEAGRAYWIKTSSFEALNVDIPKPSSGSATLLPTIDIVQGWNLVPILDVDGDFELRAMTATDNYFDGLTEGTITGIYGFDTVNSSWSRVEPQDVEIGKGYWVYATKPGFIVP